tara:strand:- start:734 stop:1486 length:753 start_codon:yes stop_codon:yes gene_type:complete
MKVNIKNLKEIVNDGLSVTQRGILITILLMKDETPKLTLAKCKASLNFTTHKEDLIYLHDKGFISWSGIGRAKKSIEDRVMEKEVVEVIDFINNLYRRGFSYKAYRNDVLRLLKDYSIEDIKKVISNRYVAWKDEPKMSMHLQPSTLFRAKNFIKYLDEANHTREGESFVNASNLNLGDGVEITLDISKQLVGTDTYNLYMYSTNGDGEKRGSSQKVSRYGKDIVKMLLVQDMNEKHGAREYRYYYNANK